MRRKKEIVTIVFGLLAAIVIVIGQANYYSAQVKALAETEATDENPEEKGAEAELKIFSNDAVSTVVQFSLIMFYIL